MVRRLLLLVMVLLVRCEQSFSGLYDMSVSLFLRIFYACMRRTPPDIARTIRDWRPAAPSLLGYDAVLADEDSFRL